jgi:hypothetical protein
LQKIHHLFRNTAIFAIQDAYDIFAAWFYQISKKLQEKDLFIYVVGKNRRSFVDKLAGGRIKIFGEVEDLLILAGSIFVILP